MGEGYADWLSRARKRRGLSGNALAQRASVDQSTISKIEAGIRSPSREMAERIALALSTDDMDDDDRARLVADAMTAAGFIPDTDTTDDEIERIPDQDINYVVHAAEGLSQTDRRKLREYVELLVLANKAQSQGGTGEKKTDQGETKE